MLRWNPHCRLAACALLAVTALAEAGFAQTSPAVELFAVKAMNGEMLLPSTNPIAGQRLTELSVEACRGEYEPASFVMRGGRTALEAVRLVATNLVATQGGATIPAENVDLRIVKPWFQGSSAWVDIAKSAPNDFRQVLVPELLLKDDSLVRVDVATGKNFVRTGRGAVGGYRWVNEGKLAKAEQVLPSLAEFPVQDAQTLQPLTLEAGMSKQIWMTIHVPPDAQTGVYMGRIEIHSSTAELGSIALRLRVHQFALAQPAIVYSVYYRGQLDPQRASIGSEYKSKIQIRRELEDLEAHGVEAPTMYQLASSRVELAEVLEMRQAFGMNRAPLFYLGIQTTETFLGSSERVAVENVAAKVPPVISMARQYGFKDVYIYGRDEAKGPALAAQRELWRAVKDAGGKVFVAGYAGAHNLVGDILDTLVYYGQPDIKESARWHASGHQIFSYANPQSGPEDPRLFRLNYGVVLWANGYDGAMPYAYQHCFGSCWNDVDDPVYRDHNFTYPTADGVVPTLAWEGFREAVDDVRYLTTLELAIAQHGAMYPDRAGQAQRFLRDLRSMVWSGQKGGGKYNRSMAIDLDDIRGEIAEHIDALEMGQIP